METVSGEICSSCGRTLAPGVGICPFDGAHTVRRRASVSVSPTDPTPPGVWAPTPQSLRPVPSMTVPIDASATTGNGLPLTRQGARPLAPPRPSSPGTPPCVPMVASLPPEAATDDAFEHELRERLARFDQGDHFERLNLPRNATTDQVRSRFVDLVMRYHPDRASARRHGQLVPLAHDLFVRLKDSYDALIDPLLRARYVAKLKSQAGGTHQSREAYASWQRGCILVIRRDFTQAEIQFRVAVGADPRPEYLAELAWALLSNPARRDETRDEIKKLVAQALQSAGRTDRVFTVAGHVEQWEQHPDRAESLFRTALEMNPQNREAAEHVHLAELRRHEAATSGWRSLFTRTKISSPRRSGDQNH